MNPLETRCSVMRARELLAIAMATWVLAGEPIRQACAQPHPAQSGRLDNVARDAMSRELQRNPNAYTFKRAYIQQVQRLKENRRMIELGLTRPRSEAERLRLTAVTGTRSVPVFLGKYSDTGADPISSATLQQELFDGPWATGTMTTFYDEISYGNLQLDGTVFDWVTVSNTDDYYSCNTNGLSCPERADFVTEIVAANDPSVDFGMFDNDGLDGLPNSGDDDGYVDFVAIVHPEIGGECGAAPSDNLWSVRSGLPSDYITDDPRAGGGMIRVDDYTIMPALSCGGGLIEIGVFCHEFGHAFGLPDLYDTDYSSRGIGAWGLMGYGSWGYDWNTPERPVHMSAWEKIELGWIVPGTVAADLLNWPITSSSNTATALKLWTNGTPGDEYFLIENRTADGFNDEIPQAGLLIWHVDESAASNTDETHKRLDLECADQSGVDHTEDADDLDGLVNVSDSGDPFCDGDTFDSSATPSSVAYNGADTGVAVADIHACGLSTMVADLIVGQPGADVDICMRDCGSDVCTEPSACDVWWASPEVYIDNNGDAVIDAPAEGIDNQLFARVRNVGTSDASDVDVGFYFADPTMGLLFPSTADLIDTDNIPLIPGGGSEAAGVIWNIPVPPATVPHWCVGVIATNAQDGQSSESTTADDNVTQINISRLVAKAGQAVPPKPNIGPVATTLDSFLAVQFVEVCNRTQSRRRFDIVIGSPPTYDDEIIPPDWSVSLDFTSVILNPGECRPLRVQVQDSNPVHTDFARVPLTLIIPSPLPPAIAGGIVLEFQIDNVAPRAPCDFTAVHTIRQGTDNNPEHNAVRISWNDDTFDVLGFPEEVERWRIYQGTNPDFLAGPSNLLVETCIDSDPSTVDYDFFADVPLDLANAWYKIIAVDQAGSQSDTCLTRLDYTVSVGDANLSGLRLAQAFPNPFRDRATLLYTLPRAGRVRLNVYTLNGRLTRRLMDDVMPGGSHQVSWDGTDDNGRRAARGVYVYKLVYEGLQRSGRVLLIR